MTLNTWITHELRNAGIDTRRYGPYSARHASASAAMVKGVPVDEILRLGGWSDVTTFIRHYNLPIRKHGTYTPPEDLPLEYQKLLCPSFKFPALAGRKVTQLRA